MAEGRRRAGGSDTHVQWNPQWTVEAGSGGAPDHLGAKRASCPPLLILASSPGASGGGRPVAPVAGAAAWWSGFGI